MKKIILMIIILLGFTACKEKERILETTKDIPINENIVFNDYSVETVEDLASFLVTVTEIENNNPVTITKVKKTFDWKIEEQEKDSYIVSAKYRDSTYELLPLIEVGASWEVCAFVSHIYLPSSSGIPYPDIFFNLLFLLLIFLNLFLIYLYSHCNLYLFLVHNIRNDIFFLIMLEFLLYYHNLNKSYYLDKM